MLKNIIIDTLVIILFLSSQTDCKGAEQPQKNKDLLEAVRSGNITAITQLLKEGADVNTKGLHNVTPLHLASIQGDCNAIKLLIKNGAKLTARNDSNDTPLYYAAMNGHLEAAKLLIEKRANVNAKNTMGESAIYPAAESGNLELVKFLVSKGAKIPTTGYTPLHSAVEGLPHSQQFESQRITMVEYFLSKGVKINAKGNSGYSGADVTVLHSGAQLSDKEIIKLLIKKGAQVNAKAKTGRTPLFNAAMGRNIGAAEVLLANGANANAYDDFNDTPLHYAIRVNNMVGHITTKNHFEVEKLLVELLLDNGADVNARNNRQYTPLFDAIDAGMSYRLSRMTPELKEQYKAILKELLEKGADPNIKDRSGRTALTLAEGEPEIIELLLKYGAKK